MISFKYLHENFFKKSAEPLLESEDCYIFCGMNMVFALRKPE